ncbi:oligosaccharide flippase family protein [Iamia sp. SCSIO 61187]|uniref:oligosaccharide flippase family protein n=1 Tax=Iamia sp. SCSIO 61187 TaxID=2722752 RepID=UPI001C629DFC|nr:oligosaccharide flippase family protein [Iamia sp. SCSIO 61187]QYG92347.1 oligosaccharide flippase family protein [Iamia sp. SCSIO 61187]
MKIAAIVGRGTKTRLLEASLVLTQATSVVVSVILARALGPEGRGALVVLMLCTQLLGWTMSFSLDKAVPILSRTTGRDKRLYYATASSSARAVSAVLLPVATVGFALWTGEALLALALALGGAAGAGYEMRLSQPLTDGNLARYSLLRIVQPITYLAFTVAALLLTASAPVQLRVVVCGLAAAASIGAAYIAAGRRLWDRPIPSRSLRRSVLRFGATVHASTVFQYLNARLDVLLVAVLFNQRDVGIYAVGAAAGQALVFMGSAGIARGLAGAAKRFDIAGILAVCVIALIGAAIAPVAVPLVFGADFADSVPIARVLLLGGVLGYGSAAANGRLLGAARPSAAALAQASGAAALVLGVTVFHASLLAVSFSAAASYGVSMAVGEALLRRDSNGRIERRALPHVPVPPE